MNLNFSIKDLWDRLQKEFVSKEEYSSSENALLTPITWMELVALRNNGELVPGALYRITDYVTTTTQENTQSAGHQFDIVLLALSDNQLAEEGWAMMHDNIYDVTFADGVTKKCYIYITDNYKVVEVETLLGTIINFELMSIDEETKTASTDECDSVDLETSDLPYNYFQNSNLSAWKVWYCLDNDKTRFAWADDSVDEGTPASLVSSLLEETFIRDSSQDNPTYGDYFGWTFENTPLWTATETPSIGDSVYGPDRERNFNAIGTVTSYTPGHEGTGLPNGRGVIYRLIDEFNNDCPYDFKNIKFLIPLDSNGDYDRNGDPTPVYTFQGPTDRSELSVIGEVSNIIIKTVELTELPMNVFYGDDGFYFYDIRGSFNFFLGGGGYIKALLLNRCTFTNVSTSTFGYNCHDLVLSDTSNLNYGNNSAELATMANL